MEELYKQTLRMVMLRLIPIIIKHPEIGPEIEKIVDDIDVDLS